MQMLQATFFHLHINSGEMEPNVIKIIHQAMQVVLCSAVEGTCTLCSACITQHSHATRSYCDLEKQDGETGAEEGAPHPSRMDPCSFTCTETLSPTFPPALPMLQKTYSSWKQTVKAG